MQGYRDEVDRDTTPKQEQESLVGVVAELAIGGLQPTHTVRLRNEIERPRDHDKGYACCWHDNTGDDMHLR